MLPNSPDRSGFNYIQKAWELYLLLVPRIEALALPFDSKRATQKPTLEPK